MRVLVGCEFSGIVRDAFKEQGHDAISCDFLDTERPGKHYKGDVKDYLRDNIGSIDLGIFHPTCTFLCNSGVCWLHIMEGRWQQMVEAAEFFKLLLNIDIPKIAIENPIPHKYALDIIGRKYDQIVQPWQFGHSETKATCLWLKNLPKLKESNNVKKQMIKLPKNVSQRLHYLPPSPTRQKERSRTFKGIAEAMASQWG